ncbi:MAG: hypothetical protein V4667_09010 [Bacteroidota bacterium]
MSYEFWANVGAITFISGFSVWLILLARLIFGLYKKDKQIIKATIKYIVNTISFLFVYIVYFSFAIVVNGPRGDERKKWVLNESLDWIIWALILSIALTLFNYFYQIKIEKTSNIKNTLILFLLNLFIMCYGIYLGGQFTLSYYL